MKHNSFLQVLKSKIKTFVHWGPGESVLFCYHQIRDVLTSWSSYVLKAKYCHLHHYVLNVGVLVGVEQVRTASCSL